MRRFVPLLTLFLLLFGSLGARAQSNPDLDKTFAAANTLLEKKQYAEALTAYQKFLPLNRMPKGRCKTVQWRRILRATIKPRSFITEN